jgi:hypothetical protein
MRFPVIEEVVGATVSHDATVAPPRPQTMGGAGGRVTRGGGRVEEDG